MYLFDIKIVLNYYFISFFKNYFFLFFYLSFNDSVLFSSLQEK